MRICMFVYNRCTTDARVLKEAATFVSSGHEVEIIAVLDATTELVEERDGFVIRRIDRRPLHYRLLWRIRASRRRLRLTAARVRRAVRIAIRRLWLPVRVHGRRLVRRAWRLQHRWQRRASRLQHRWQRRARAVAGARWMRRLRRALGPRGSSEGTDQVTIVRARVRRIRRRRAVHRVRRAVQILAAPLALPAGLVRILGWGVRRVAALPGYAYRRLERAAYVSLMSFHKPLMFIDYWTRAYRLALQQPADSYHAHDVLTLPVAVLLARRTGARLVYDAHELYSEISTLSPLERRAWSLLERAFIRRPDEVITVCDSIADELVHRYRISRPTIVLNCPPPESESAVLPAAVLNGHQAPIILYQGGFAPFRGLETLVLAARALDRGSVILMGWGTLEKELRSLVVRHGLTERVRIVPPVPQPLVVAAARCADIGVIPYEPVGLNNTFTTPNKLFDYMAAGLSIVASRLPELERFVAGHELGLTFTPGDPDELAAALNTLLADRRRREQMGANALSAAGRYTWENESRKLLAAHVITAASPLPPVPCPR